MFWKKKVSKKEFGRGQKTMTHGYSGVPI